MVLLSFFSVVEAPPADGASGGVERLVLVFACDGDQSLGGVKRINLYNLAECVHSFSGFLTGAADALSEYLDQKREWEYEARAEDGC